MGTRSRIESSSNEAFVQGHIFGCALLAEADWRISSVRGADLWQTNWIRGRSSHVGDGIKVAFWNNFQAPRLWWINSECLLQAGGVKAAVVLQPCAFRLLSGWELPWKTTASVSASSISLLYLPQLECRGCGYSASIAIVGVSGEYAWDRVSKPEDSDKQPLWGEN